jgi:hypothetical protein
MVQGTERRILGTGQRKTIAGISCTNLYFEACMKTYKVQFPKKLLVEIKSEMLFLHIHKMVTGCKANKITC